MNKEVFQKYKLALRKYLLNNKEKVAKDLEKMREKSNQNNMNKEKLPSTIGSGGFVDCELNETFKNKQPKFKVGDKAHKTKGYKFPCTIVGVFETIKGDIRVVGEMDEYGLLHIFNEDQLEHYGKDEPDLLNEAYMDYYWIMGDKIKITQNEFINKCKIDPEFSEKWGLKIEERELSLEERKSIYETENTNGIEVENNHWLESKLKTRNIPTKLITLTYNNETIESYE